MLLQLINALARNGTWGELDTHKYNYSDKYRTLNISS